MSNPVVKAGSNNYNIIYHLQSNLELLFDAINIIAFEHVMLCYVSPGTLGLFYVL